MNAKIPYAVAATLATALLTMGVASAQSAAYDDVLYESMPGEFIIGNARPKGIAHNKTDQRYRICVTRTDLNIPVKVLHDGQQSMVAPGDCADFEAMNLEVAAGSNVPEDAIVLGHFQHLR